MFHCTFNAKCLILLQWVHSRTADNLRSGQKFEHDSINNTSVSIQCTFMHKNTQLGTTHSQMTPKLWQNMIWILPVINKIFTKIKQLLNFTSLTLMKMGQVINNSIEQKSSIGDILINKYNTALPNSDHPPMANWHNVVICFIIFDKILWLVVWLEILNIRFESKIVCGKKIWTKWICFEKNWLNSFKDTWSK